MLLRKVKMKIVSDNIKFFVYTMYKILHIEDIHQI